MAYSCCAAFSATYRTLSRSLPKGRCGPCFSMMPNGSRHAPCARAMASRKSAAVSSSQCTDSLLCAGAGEGDCAHTIEAQSVVMESSSDLYTCPPAMVIHDFNAEAEGGRESRKKLTGSEGGLNRGHTVRVRLDGECGAGVRSSSCHPATRWFSE